MEFPFCQYFFSKIAPQAFLPSFALQHLSLMTTGRSQLQLFKLFTCPVSQLWYLHYVLASFYCFYFLFIFSHMFSLRVCEIIQKVALSNQAEHELYILPLTKLVIQRILTKQHARGSLQQSGPALPKMPFSH